MRHNRSLIDTDVLIDYLRGQKQAVAYLDSVNTERMLSVITIAELNSGIRNASEQDIIDDLILSFDVIPIDSETAKLGGQYRRRYSKSHGTGLGDALIAATAYLHQAELVTLNTRHFPMLNAVHAPYKKHN